MPKVLKGYLWFLTVYSVLTGLYFWLDPGGIPAKYIGTPADPASFFSKEQLDKSHMYRTLGNWLYFMSIPWNWGIYLLLLSAGWASGWRDRWTGEGRKAWLALPVYMFLISAAGFLLYLPLSVTGYALSKHFGISVQPVTGWLRDKAVSFGIEYVTMLVVAAAAFFVIRKGGRWWLKLWLLSVPFTLFMMYIQPVVIDPLYNTYTELQDRKLEKDILDLAAKAGIPAERVYEVDMSEKTNALNAYVNGIGGSLRIVLWDTTLGRLDKPEILTVMAHEMGHYVKHHLEWSALGAVVSSFFLLAAGAWLLKKAIGRWGGDWGIRGPGDMAALPLMLLLISLMSVAAAPFSNAVSRHAEAQADTYAMKLYGKDHVSSAVSLHQKLAVSSLSDVNPPLLVKLFRSTHPSTLERIVDALSYGQTGKKE
ncbi:M48 family metallopeptidase [Paenibacillus gansuensis]|uniref:M48 family metallopeptidase n=1 Tax=Paenibacillus gansuensis TaxID=306542 RepID=A0ABW5PH86_9BACL